VVETETVCSAELKTLGETVRLMLSLGEIDRLGLTSTPGSANELLGRRDGKRKSDRKNKLEREISA